MRCRAVRERPACCTPRSSRTPSRLLRGGGGGHAREGRRPCSDRGMHQPVQRGARGDERAHVGRGGQLRQQRQQAQQLVVGGVQEPGAHRDAVVELVRKDLAQRGAAALNGRSAAPQASPCQRACPRGAVLTPARHASQQITAGRDTPDQGLHCRKLQRDRSTSGLG